jgi:hypothetical protein
MNLGTTDPIAGGELTEGLGYSSLLGRQTIELRVVLGERSEELSHECADGRTCLGGPNTGCSINLIRYRDGDVFHSHTVPQFHSLSGATSSSGG